MSKKKILEFVETIISKKPLLELVETIFRTQFGTVIMPFNQISNMIEFCSFLEIKCQFIDANSFVNPDAQHPQINLITEQRYLREIPLMSRGQRNTIEKNLIGISLKTDDLGSLTNPLKKQYERISPELIIEKMWRFDPEFIIERMKQNFPIPAYLYGHPDFNRFMYYIYERIPDIVYAHYYSLFCDKAFYRIDTTAGFPSFILL